MSNILNNRLAITKTFVVAISLSVMWIELSASDVYAASVKRKLAKRSVIVIDEGSTSGVNKQDEVCFYDTYDQELGCGMVRRVKEDRSFVKVDRQLFTQIRRGFVASYSSDSSGGGDKTVNLVAGLGWLIPHYSFAMPKYTKKTAPYWEPVDGSNDFELSKKLNKSSAILIMELELLSIFTKIGARFSLYSPQFSSGKKYEINYKQNSTLDNECEQNTKNKLPYCYVELEFTYPKPPPPYNFGFYGQFNYPFELTDGVQYKIGLGLDLDYSKINTTARYLTDKKPSVFTPLVEDAVSSTFVLSARLVPLHIAMDINSSVAIVFEGVVNFGLFSFGSKTETKDKNYLTSDNNVQKSNQEDQDKKDYVEKFFHEALNLRHSIMGGSFSLGIQFSI